MLFHSVKNNFIIINFKYNRLNLNQISNIHNQSYIHIEKKYKLLKIKNQSLNNIIQEQTNLILNLTSTNNKLQSENLNLNKKLDNQNKELINKDRYINLNYYSKFNHFQK